MSREERLGRDGTIFAVTLATVLPINYWVKTKVNSDFIKLWKRVKPSRRDEEFCKLEADTHMSNLGKDTGGDEEYFKVKDKCLMEKAIERSPFQPRLHVAGLAGAAGGFVLGLALFTAYYLWDWGVEKQPSNISLIRAAVFAVMVWLFNVMIVSIGRPKNNGEVIIYSLATALFSASLSALIHDFYD